MDDMRANEVDYDQQKNRHYRDKSGVLWGCVGVDGDGSQALVECHVPAAFLGQRWRAGEDPQVVCQQRP